MPEFRKPPYIRSRESVPKRGWIFSASLLPIVIVSLFFFRLAALRLMFVTVTAALAAECLARLLARKKPALYDGSSFLYGLMLSFLLPAGLPWWMAAAGAFFTIFLCKEMFGGLGQYPFQPVAAGHAFLAAAFPLAMNSYVTPFGMQETMTPLLRLKTGLLEVPGWAGLFWGNHAGGLGETCAAAILVSVLLLVWQRLILWEVPLVFLGTLALCSYLAAEPVPLHLFAGGSFFTAAFLVTDPATTPHTRAGARAFAAAAAALTFLLRTHLFTADATSFAVLIACAGNIWLDRFFRPRGTRMREGVLRA